MRAKFLPAVCLIILMAGCSTSVGGAPSPATNSTAPTTSDSGGAPKVGMPIDTSRFEKEPCATLSTDQLGQLSIKTQPQPDTGNKLGPGCEWNAYDEVGLTVGARLLTIGSSLANLYKQHAQGRLPFFQPTEVSGYPAILTDSLDADPKGKCSVEVGVRDDLLYSVQVTISSDSGDYANPCPVAKKAAEMAVSTMKAGA